MLRREFIQSASAIGITSCLSRPLFARAGASAEYFGLHPFIDAHPEAVFIQTTDIAAKTDTAAKLSVGNAFAKEIFVLRDTPGISLASTIAIKPNLTVTFGTGTSDAGIGIVTDADFMEGLISGMQEQGFPAANMYLREGNMLADGYCRDDYALTGYPRMAQRLQVNLTDFPTRKIYASSSDTLEPGTEVIWTDCPEGVVFKRIGYIAPIHAPNSWLLNIAKFKTHGMGMSLCVKNLQGSCVFPYIRFCSTLAEIQAYPAGVLADFQPDLPARIANLHARHVRDGVPRWDRPGQDSTGGLGMEVWAQRTCDSHSVTTAGLSIIEGIYGRNGNGFTLGPGPNGEAQDCMVNMLVFGKNPFLVDVIGTWLGGHEPGNFGLFHIARERGLCATFNPAEIPLYGWNAGQPALTPLSAFNRTPLVTNYLRRDYNGGNEAEYHLVNEPYQYSSIARHEKAAAQPAISIIGTIRRSDGRAAAIIQYTLPHAGMVVIDVFNAAGERVDALVDRWVACGTHMAPWNCMRRAAGSYYIRMRFDSAVTTARIPVAG